MIIVQNFLLSEWALVGIGLNMLLSFSSLLFLILWMAIELLNKPYTHGLISRPVRINHRLSHGNISRKRVERKEGNDK